MYSGEGKAAQTPNNIIKGAPPTGKWTTGLFDCFEEPGICCLTWSNPCIAFGRNVEIIDQGRTSATTARWIFCGLSWAGVPCLYSFGFRSKLRELYNLPEEPCMDFCVHCWCGICAICQEHRELKNRGLDPSKGWKANEEKMRKANQVPPRVVPSMTR